MVALLGGTTTALLGGRGDTTAALQVDEGCAASWAAEWYDGCTAWWERWTTGYHNMSMSFMLGLS